MLAAALRVTFNLSTITGADLLHAAIATPPTRQVLLSKFAVACTELLVLDELWTKAVQDRETTAPELGRRMTNILDFIGNTSSEVAVEVGEMGPEFDVAWNSLAEDNLSPEGLALLSEEVGPHASARVSAFLRSQEWRTALGAEGAAIEMQIKEIENPSGSGPEGDVTPYGPLPEGDVTPYTRKWLGIALACAAVVVAAAISAGASPVVATATAVGSLALVGFHAAITALADPRASAPPPAISN